MMMMILNIMMIMIIMMIMMMMTQKVQVLLYHGAGWLARYIRGLIHREIKQTMKITSVFGPHQLILRRSFITPEIMMRKNSECKLGFTNKIYFDNLNIRCFLQFDPRILKHGNLLVRVISFLCVQYHRI